MGKSKSVVATLPGGTPLNDRHGERGQEKITPQCFGVQITSMVAFFPKKIHLVVDLSSPIRIHDLQIMYIFLKNFGQNSHERWVFTSGFPFRMQN